MRYKKNKNPYAMRIETELGFTFDLPKETPATSKMATIDAKNNLAGFNVADLDTLNRASAVAAGQGFANNYLAANQGVGSRVPTQSNSAVKPWSSPHEMTGGCSPA